MYLSVAEFAVVEAAPATVTLVKVPTDVKLELTTVDFKVVPVKEPAGAVLRAQEELSGSCLGALRQGRAACQRLPHRAA